MTIPRSKPGVIQKHRRDGTRKGGEYVGANFYAQMFGCCRCLRPIFDACIVGLRLLDHNLCKEEWFCRGRPITFRKREELHFVGWSNRFRINQWWIRLALQLRHHQIVLMSLLVHKYDKICSWVDGHIWRWIILSWWGRRFSHRR